MVMKPLLMPVVQAIAWTTLAIACAGVASVATAQSPPSDLPNGEVADFRVDKAAFRSAGASAALLEKAGASPFRYFRLLARQFAARTCFEFRDIRWRLPAVAVHGDAHLEQFVVTGESYGLEDFDMAGFGPSVVDLVRFGASLHLACRQAGWPCNPDQAVEAYFSAYAAALDRPVVRTAPAIVGRLRAVVPQEPLAWLAWADALMQPLPPGDEAAIRRGAERFVRLMRETGPSRSEGFYTISKVGRVDLGIGSALEVKTLIRVDGPTPAPDDDLILEARRAVPTTHPECISRPGDGSSLHILMLTALLGPRLPDVFGFMPIEGAQEAPEVWIQSWDRGYRELSTSDIGSQSELDELAVDAGRQLAGHFWSKFPEPLRGHQRFAQLRAFEATEKRARQLAREFAAETVIEWERFRSQP